MKSTYYGEVARDRSTTKQNEIAGDKVPPTMQHQRLPEATRVIDSEVLAAENDSNAHAATVGVTRIPNSVLRSGQTVSNAEPQVTSHQHAAERGEFRR